ncbi:MAG: hypothetical protein DKINENOH_05069 [bacterium]|nr:hypothetical protein [bacterium]
MVSSKSSISYSVVSCVSPKRASSSKVLKVGVGSNVFGLIGAARRGLFLFLVLCIIFLFQSRVACRYWIRATAAAIGEDHCQIPSAARPAIGNVFSVFGFAQKWAIFENFFDFEKLYAMLADMGDVPVIPFTRNNSHRHCPRNSNKDCIGVILIEVTSASRRCDTRPIPPGAPPFPGR